MSKDRVIDSLGRIDDDMIRGVGGRAGIKRAADQNRQFG